MLGIPLLPSLNTAETAALLYALARQLQVGYQQPGGSPARKAKTVAEQQRGVLMALPGIGPVTARALLARFGSVGQVVQAEVEALTAITGITPTRAGVLIEIPRSPYAYASSPAGLPDLP